MTAPLTARPDLTPVTTRSTAEVTTGRHDARQRWEQARAELPRPSATTSREGEPLMERRQSWYALEEQALARWDDAPVDPTDARPSVLLVHRHEWLRNRVEPALTVQGWQVLDGRDQAAEAVAALITRQPQVLLTSDRVAGESGLELVSRARELSPSTTIVVQVDQEDRAPLFLEAGADLVLSHRATWRELVDAVAALSPALPASA